MNHREFVKFTAERVQCNKVSTSDQKVATFPAALTENFFCFLKANLKVGCLDCTELAPFNYKSNKSLLCFQLFSMNTLSVSSRSDPLAISLFASNISTLVDKQSTDGPTFSYFIQQSKFIWRKNMKLRAYLCLMISVSAVSCSRLPLKRVGLLQKFAARLGNELSSFEFSFTDFH